VIRQPQTRTNVVPLQAGESQRIFAQLRRYFAPASILPAPGSSPTATGGRNTVLTAQSSPITAPTDSASIRLKAGQLTWYYRTRFRTPPNVTATAVGQVPGTPPTNPGLHLKGPGSVVAVIVISDNNTDARLVQLHAVGTN
jgi:hypothetical protein